MTRLGKRATIASLLAVAGASYWLMVDHSVSLTSIAVAPIRRSQPDPASERSVTDRTARLRIERDWANLLAWLRTDPKPNAEEILLRMKATRKAWAEADPQTRAETIAKLLESGADAATGLDFRVGVHGMLASWPTLRVFLLDLLAVSDPKIAVATARKLLDKTTSPDEYATALRSLTCENSRASGSELHARFEYMLAQREWQTSRGFAEALDLARYLGTSDAARQLATWKGALTLKTLAMDEFTAAHPQAMFTALEEEALTGNPPPVNLIARARPEDPAQLAAVDRYLKTPSLTDEDAVAFFSIYPLRGATTGHRLYGKLPAPYDFEQIQAGDLAALRQVERWAEDPKMEKYRPEIQALRQRLSEWVSQANDPQND